MRYTDGSNRGKQGQHGVRVEQHLVRVAGSLGGSTGAQSKERQAWARHRTAQGFCGPGIVWRGEDSFWQKGGCTVVSWVGRHWVGHHYLIGRLLKKEGEQHGAPHSGQVMENVATPAGVVIQWPGRALQLQPSRAGLLDSSGSRRSRLSSAPGLGGRPPPQGLQGAGAAKATRSLNMRTTPNSSPRFD